MFIMLSVKDTYLYENGRPFFWLGDTAWLIFEKLSMNDIEIYLKNRKSLGYNVIQAVLFYSMPKWEGVRPNSMPVYDRETFTKDYIRFVNTVIARAKDFGMYVALVPTWGSYVKQNLLSEENAEMFATFLTDHFSHHENLIWVMGGDVYGSVNINAFSRLASSIKEKDHRHLITFHPYGRTLSARWFNDSKWLDFNMFQSGHRRYDQMQLKSWDDERELQYGEDAWRYVEENHAYAPRKPCLDAEPSYEGIIQGLHDPKQPYWEEKHVRRYAYWTVFAGACGFTYGNNAIIQFYDPEKGPGAYSVRESWKEALHSPGGMQLKILKNLMESVDFTRGWAHEDYLLSPQRERCHRISVFAGDDFLFVYDYAGDPFEISLKAYREKRMDAFWMNPQTGVLSYIQTYAGEDAAAFYPTTRREDSNDWVLVLKEADENAETAACL